MEIENEIPKSMPPPLPASNAPVSVNAGLHYATANRQTMTPPSLDGQRLRVGPIIRDVVIVWVLTAMGGFVAGIATGGPSRDAQRFMLAIAVSNFLFGTVAFTISGLTVLAR